MLFGVAPFQQLYGDVECLARVVPSVDSASAVEVRADPDVLDPDQLDDVVDVIDIVSDIRTRPLRINRCSSAVVFHPLVARELGERRRPHVSGDEPRADVLRQATNGLLLLGRVELDERRERDRLHDAAVFRDGPKLLVGEVSAHVRDSPDSRETLDALQGYRDQGGALMYMGGNGFYWRIALHPDEPGILEIRRGEGGIRAWAAEPGEYYNAFDGNYGGLWRRSGRAPQVLAGVGFSAQGTFVGSYYRRNPDTYDDTVFWVFDGVSDEVLGDFGLCGGGAAGFELDRVDECLGSPPSVRILASSENHTDDFVVVPEEMLTHLTNWPGEPMEKLIRADMVYFETPAGGRVFSTGSITFCGSLLHNDGDNNISRIVANVLDRFLA